MRIVERTCSSASAAHYTGGEADNYVRETWIIMEPRKVNLG